MRRRRVKVETSCESGIDVFADPSILSRNGNKSPDLTKKEAITVTPIWDHLLLVCRRVAKQMGDDQGNHHPRPPQCFLAVP